MEKFKCGDIVSGEVTGITKYGVFVKLSDEYVGMIHISEISNKFINSVERLYVLGETIESKIIEIDNDKKQIKLSTKELNFKNKNNKILKEQGSGFGLLKDNLDFWISEKLAELQKKSKTP